MNDKKQAYTIQPAEVVTVHVKPGAIVLVTPDKRWICLSPSAALDVEEHLKGMARAAADMLLVPEVSPTLYAAARRAS